MRACPGVGTGVRSSTVNAADRGGRWWSRAEQSACTRFGVLPAGNYDTASSHRFVETVGTRSLGRSHPRGGLGFSTQPREARHRSLAMLHSGCPDVYVGSRFGGSSRHVRSPRLIAG